MWDSRLIAQIQRKHRAGAKLDYDEVSYLLSLLDSKTTPRRALIADVATALRQGQYNDIEVATASIVDRDREADHRRADYYDRLSDRAKKRLYQDISNAK